MKNRNRFWTTDTTRCAFCNNDKSHDNQERGENAVVCMQTGIRFCSGACLANCWRSKCSGLKPLVQMLNKPFCFQSVESKSAFCNENDLRQIADVMNHPPFGDTAIVCLIHSSLRYRSLSTFFHSFQNAMAFVAVGCDVLRKPIAPSTSNVLFDVGSLRSTDTGLDFGDAVSFAVRSATERRSARLVICALGFEKAHRPLLCGMARIASTASPQNTTIACMIPTLPLVCLSSGVKMAEHLVHAAASCQ